VEETPMVVHTKSLTWLHLSDLHCCKPKSNWDANAVIGTLVNDLKRMQTEHNLRPDFIFFTGDAAFGQIGKAEGERITDQFKVAKDFFDLVR
jgi:predicted MPP superfamily phosphohydrolase